MIDKIKLRKYRDMSTKLKSKLSNAEATNKNFTLLRKDLDEIQECKEQFSELLEFFKTAYLVSSKEDGDYKRRRLEFLSSYIKKNLNIVFPYDNLDVKVQTDFKNNRNKATLELWDENKKKAFIPKMNQGGLGKQLISFSAATALVECKDRKFLLLDEPFSESAPDKLSIVSTILNELLNKGMQIILIEHKDEVYKELPRREFVLEKDALTSSVKVLSVTDY